MASAGPFLSVPRVRFAHFWAGLCTQLTPFDTVFPAILNPVGKQSSRPPAGPAEVVMAVVTADHGPLEHKHQQGLSDQVLDGGYGLAGGLPLADDLGGPSGKSSGRARLRSCPDSAKEASVVRRSQTSRLRSAGRPRRGHRPPRSASRRLSLSGPRRGGHPIPFPTCCRWINGPRVGLLQKSEERGLSWIPPERTALSLCVFGAVSSGPLVLSSIISAFSASCAASGPVSSPMRPPSPAGRWPTRPVWYGDPWGSLPRGRSWWPSGP